MNEAAMCLNKQCPSYTRCITAQGKPKAKQLWTSFIVLPGNMRCKQYEEMSDGIPGRVGQIDTIDT